MISQKYQSVKGVFAKKFKIAITKDGDSYYIYDYATGNRTKAHTKDGDGKVILPKAQGACILQIMNDITDAVYKAQMSLPRVERLSRQEITRAFYKIREVAEILTQPL